MPEISKFKAVTVIFILLFIFCIAAMYTNTKDVATGKSHDTYEAINDTDNEVSYSENKAIKGSAEIRDLSERVSNLEIQYGRITQQEDNNSKINCNIQGVMSGDILVPLSQTESLAEARDNGKEIVMLCSFK